MSELWKLFTFHYFQEKPPEIVLCSSGVGYMQVHRDLFYQTKVMFDMLSLAESKTNPGDKISIIVPSIDGKHLEFAMYYLYNGEIHPQDQDYTCLEILVDVFGFPQIIYGFDPRPPNLESESSQSLATTEITAVNENDQSIEGIDSRIVERISRLKNQQFVGNYSQTEIENMKIIHWLLGLKRRVNWQEMVQAKIMPGRSKMAIQRRFFDSIMPSIENYGLSLDEKNRLKIYTMGHH